MEGRRKYVKKPDSFVTAVQLDLDTEGFTYEKWGGTQACKPGDWVVNNGGDVYTVDQATFAETYRTESPGVYVKIVPVWAEVAAEAGVIETKEGSTAYQVGDYLVFNETDAEEGWAVKAEKFEGMYEQA